MRKNSLTINDRFFFNKLEPLIYHQSRETQQLNCAHKKDSRRGGRSPRVRNMKSAGLKTGSINEVHTNEAMNSPADVVKDLHFDRKSSNNDIEEEKAEPKEEKLDANITQTAE